MKKAAWIYWVVLSVVFFWGCDRVRMVEMDGKIMGTEWKVRCALSVSTDPGEVQNLLEKRLHAINRSLSVYVENSDVSRFNRMKAEETMVPDVLFMTVLHAAREVYEWTEGAFDPTVLPLVNLWGFGPDGYHGYLPDTDALEQVKKNVGMNRLIFYEDGRIGKQEDGISLDLGAIAKGYGVDLLAETLEEAGIRHYLVEIGGEIRVGGCRPDGTPWVLGISRPFPGSAPSDLLLRMEICNGSLATSGDYRNFFESGGRRFSHVMDPLTGYPVETGIVSASVLHKSSMKADALATAIMVMGMEKARAMVARLDGVEALVVKEIDGGVVESWMSPGFMEKLR
ncbi:FAD:protein FMN transferase [Desulfobotulus sp. H1]|uniref:FAD:protein FMN transferase n=1 Tax=Desulfobotulus pelophilus TaxID=2823377 RepID=A0ABT3NB98_9BACT|nr:FAD:protein FMN transferase [Desulfobotulus pelophilus]MCW7754733.1 FAD:protein FMN transferase [Desulfobotulus pelophilus]